MKGFKPTLSLALNEFGLSPLIVKDKTTLKKGLML